MLNQFGIFTCSQTKQEHMPKYGIYSEDGTPLALEALDISTNRILRATVFETREVAQIALDNIPQDMRDYYGKFEIKEIFDA
jgi:hypothetical protein